MNRLFIKVAALALAVLLSIPAFAEAPASRTLDVWLLTSLERAMRDTPPGHNRTLKLQAAGNEWESFQIAVRSAKPVRILQISYPITTSVPIIPPLRFYREHALQITRPTYRNEAFKPGWYPDALIPFASLEATSRAKEARFRAVPFDLPANETHAFWVDLHIPKKPSPPKLSIPFIIQMESGASEKIAVDLEVWDFALSDRPTMYSEFGNPSDRVRQYYGNLVKKGVLQKEPDLDAVARQCAQVMVENRLNAPPPAALLRPKVNEDGSFELTAEQIAGLKAWDAEFHLNAVPLPRPQSYFKDPAADREKINRWCKSWDRALDAAGLGDRLAYIYLLDEPNDEKAYDEVRRWGKAVREAGSRVKILVTEQTAPQEDGKWGDLYGAIDLWVPLFSLFDPETAAKRQALGEQIWTYTALCQGKPTPWWQTDFPLTHYRVPAWMAWRYDMKGLLYWASLVHWSHVEDPWTDPATYQPGDRSRPIEKRSIYNGEGLLAYPGRDVGIDGIVPSMRLKALRDGLEDFDYFALLPPESREKALAIMAPVATSWYEWSNDPEKYYEARRRIAELIVQNKQSGARP